MDNAKDIAEELQGATVDEQLDSKEDNDNPPEKMLSVSRVNELVKKAKRDKEKQMQEQLDAAKQQIEQLQAQQGQNGQNQQNAQPQQQQQPQVDMEQIQQNIMAQMQQKMEEQERLRHQEQMQREVEQVAHEYTGKMSQGKDLYDDFEAITADFNPAEFPQLVFLANQMDNTADIIYDLQKNPAKLAQLLVWMDKSPSMARKELGKLSTSIKDNQSAKKNLQEAQDPLARLKSSPTGTDNGTKSLRDLKAASFLRG